MGLQSYQASRFRTNRHFGFGGSSDHQLCDSANSTELIIRSQLEETCKESSIFEAKRSMNIPYTELHSPLSTQSSGNSALLFSCKSSGSSIPTTNKLIVANFSLFGSNLTITRKTYYGENNVMYSECPLDILCGKNARTNLTENSRTFKRLKLIFIKDADKNWSR